MSQSDRKEYREDDVLKIHEERLLRLRNVGERMKDNLTSVESCVLNVLRNSLEEGIFLPGEEIKEKDISTALGVSRMPIRQALIILENEGFLYRIPRRGFFLKQVDRDELEEIYAMRSALEQIAVRRAIERCTDEDFETIEAFLNTIAMPLNTAVFLGNNRRFHEMLCAPSGWHRLLCQIRTLRRNLATHIAYLGEYPKERIRESHMEHRQIFEAYKRKDIDCTLHLVAEHNIRACEVLLKMQNALPATVSSNQRESASSFPA
jgi:DNA-binding GntR family transcriptional regulator